MYGETCPGKLTYTDRQRRLVNEIFLRAVSGGRAARPRSIAETGETRTSLINNQSVQKEAAVRLSTDEPPNFADHNMLAQNQLAAVCRLCSLRWPVLGRFPSLFSREF